MALPTGYVWTLIGRDPEDMPTRSGKQDELVGLTCADTDTFRSMATALLTPHDVVMEIGSSYGKCTELIVRAVGGEAGRVVGCEISKEALAAAEALCPGAMFSAAARHCAYQLLATNHPPPTDDQRTPTADRQPPPP